MKGSYLDIAPLLGLLEQPKEWHEEALCPQVDPDIFFPDKGDTTAAAKRVCGMCPVSAECLQYAFDNDIQWGVWGGLSETERRGRKPRASDLVPEKAARDEEIMRLVAAGESSVKIAASVGVALVTVKRVRARFSAAGATAQSTVTEAA